MINSCKCKKNLWKASQYAKCLKVVEIKKYYTWREINNLQNISAISNCISNISNLILKIVNWTNTKNTKSFDSKIKQGTLCNPFKEGGLKNVDINSKIVSLQCSWIKGLYDDKFHKWKLIKSTFGINFKFPTNLDFEDSKFLTFPSFYIQLFRNWRKYLSSSGNIPSSILSQPIRYNKNIKINSKPIYVEEFAKQNIIFLYDRFLISFSYMNVGWNED